MCEVGIRMAREEDAAELLAVYRPYVEQTAVTFEYEVPTEEEFRGRIRAVLERLPYLVAEQEGRILGYAYAHPFHSRAAYSWSAETSVYVRQGEHGRGIGRSLYGKLEEILARQHIINLNACIAWPNPESVAFHTAFGYRKVAHFTQCGYKLGRWYDMIWMEKMLCETHPNPPQPVLWLPELLRKDGN